MAESILMRLKPLGYRLNAYDQLWTYSLSPTEAIITNYIGPMGGNTNVDVPAIIDFKPTVLQSNIFYSKFYNGFEGEGFYINNITIPSTIRFVDNSAAYLFYGLGMWANNTTPSLTKLPSTTTNMAYTYSSSGINSVYFPPNVIDATGAYAACQNITSIPTPLSFNSPINLCVAFEGCGGITSVNIGNINTDSYIAALFCACSNLKNVNFTGSTIPNNIGSMFACCYNLTSINGLPSNITDMHSCFEMCYNLSTVPTLPPLVQNCSRTFYSSGIVNAPNIPNSVTNINQMFYNCTKMINAPKVFGSNVSGNASYLFYNCTSLVNGPEEWLSENTDNFSYMFKNCNKLKNCNFTIPNSVTNMAEMFYNCTNLINTPGLLWNVQNLANAFFNCSNITQLPTRISNATNLFSSFANCQKLSQLSECVVETTKSPNVAYMFHNCTNLLSTPQFGAGGVSNSYYMFKNCCNLPVVNLFIVNGGTVNYQYSFVNCYNLTTLQGSTLFGITNNVNLYRSFCASNHSNFTYTKLNRIDANYVTLTNTYERCKYLVTANQFPDNVIAMNYTFCNCPNLTTVTNVPTTLTNLCYCFCNCQNLTTVPEDFGNKITNMSSAFENCYKLTNAPNIPNTVSNLANAFRNCKNLTSFPKSGIGTGVKNLYRAFYNCYSIANDLNCYSKSISNASQAFYNITKPIEIRAYPNTTTWNTLVKNINNACMELIDLYAYENTMQNFNNLFTYTNNSTHIIITNYKGGGGNVYVPNKYNGFNIAVGRNTFSGKTTVTNIHFAKNIIAQNTNGTNMFNGCTNLNRITGKIPEGYTDGSYMFYDSGIKYIEADALPQSLTNLYYGFYSCESLNCPINIPNNVGNLYYTFGYCSNLNSKINVGTGVTDMRYCFRYATAYRNRINIYSNNVSNAYRIFYNTSTVKNIYVYSSTTTNTTLQGVNGSWGINVKTF